MEKLKGKRIQIIHRNDQRIIDPTSSLKGAAFFRFFTSLKSNHIHGHGPTTLPSPVFVKETDLKVSRMDLGTIRNWVALEEKIVHDYKERKVVTTKIEPMVPLVEPKVSKLGEKEEIPVSATFNTLPPAVLLASPPSKESTSDGLKIKISSKLIAILACAAASIFILLLGQEYLSHQSTAVQLAQVWGEKKQLERFYNDLSVVLDNQRNEIFRLNTQLRNTTGELRTAQQKAVGFDAMERSYRDELVRVTTHYEAQLESLRRVIQVEEDLLGFLPSQVRAIEKLVSKEYLKNVMIDSLKSIQEEEQLRAVSLANPTSVRSQGKVIMINSRYGFVVVDLGSNQGAREGRRINIFKNSKTWIAGKIERVYPAVSAATIFDNSLLNDLQEGDDVSFSS